MTQLPIHAVIPDIQKALLLGNELILQAPPGAGKTTAVPLSLLNQHWLKGKILVLEPRRMAARAAAQRMAHILNENVGETVGYRIRQETRLSSKTKIEVVTGGVLTRLLLDDPSLEAYSLIIFDEFHERSLDSDLGLVLALHGRSIFRDNTHPLKLLLMSATLDSQEMSNALNNAPILQSEGRMFPVDIFYSGSSKQNELVERVTSTIQLALKQQKGSILVFLPGQKEILAVFNKLNGQVDSNIKIATLYGNLSLEQQQQAIDPISSNEHFIRKIVLSTDIAETSLTIEGVSVIVDSGFRREPIFDPKTGLTRLQTVRISHASATQRMGRAGRLEPGTCYRVWHREECLHRFNKTAIEQADLAPLLLQLLAFGINLELDALHWITPPPSSTLNQAIDLLESLGAIVKNGSDIQLSKHGQQLVHFPAHPRLAHMMMLGAQHGLAREATILAAVLSETGKPANLGYDIEQWVTRLNTQAQQRDFWYQQVNKQSATYLQSLKNIPIVHSTPQNTPIGFLLALAYPDRIACKRDQERNVYQLSNGRSAELEQTSTLQKHQWLCVAEIGGTTHSSSDRIYSATALHPELFTNELKSVVTTGQHTQWDEQQNRLVAERRWTIGNILWKTQKNPTPSLEQKRKVIIDLVRQKGVNILSWNDECLQWCARVNLLRQNASNTKADTSVPWPDVSPTGLLQSLEHWLEPYIDQVSTLQDFKKLELKQLLSNLLPWPLPQTLDECAPTHFTVPSGSHIAIDYTQTPPVLAVKLQEMFGCQNTPRIAYNSVALVVHLLSPARRPLQVTQDLAGFWRGSYQDVKREMKGRYPKHPWPDDPLTALPTRHTKHYKK